MNAFFLLLLDGLTNKWKNLMEHPILKALVTILFLIYSFLFLPL